MAMQKERRGISAGFRCSCGHGREQTNPCWMHTPASGGYTRFPRSSVAGILAHGLIAEPAFPELCSSGFDGSALRLQLRGQPRNWPRGGSTAPCSLLSPAWLGRVGNLRFRRSGSRRAYLSIEKMEGRRFMSPRRIREASVIRFSGLYCSESSGRRKIASRRTCQRLSS